MNRWSFVVVREVIAGIGGVPLAAVVAAALCPAGRPSGRVSGGAPGSLVGKWS
ncbi:MAG TPA: hypothetical protein VGB74_12740 [Actinoplanes sp.]